MRDTLYDYRGLRLSNIASPRYRHLLLLLIWVAYFALYILTERLIPEESCAVMHCGLDDAIPFCEYFVVFYVFWYLLIFGSLAYLLFCDVKSFSNLQIFIGITQLLAMFCYIFFPTRQDLRPAVFERDNAFTWVLGIIYSVDTSTGVCPSLHVAYSCGVASVFWKKKSFPVWFRTATVVLVVCICLSTMFVKQHSAIDVCFGVITGIIAEVCVYGVPRIMRGKRHK